MQYDGGNAMVMGSTTGSPLVLTASTPVAFQSKARTSQPHMAYEYGSEILVPDLVRHIAMFSAPRSLTRECVAF